MTKRQKGLNPTDPERLTKRELAEELRALRERHARLEARFRKASGQARDLRQLLDALPGALVLVDLREGKPLYVSRNYEGLFGRKAEEVRPAPELFVGHLHPEDRGRMLSLFKGLTGAGATAEGLVAEFRVLTKEGGLRWVSSRGQTVCDGRGRPHRLALVAEDITAQRRNDLAVRVLTDATEDSMVLLDTRGHILAINRSGARRLGRSTHDLLGQCAYGLLPPEVARTRKGLLDGVAERGMPAHFEDSRDGMDLEHHVYPVMDESGRVEKLAVFSKDVTEQKQRGRRLAESQEMFRLVCEQANDGVVVVDLARKGFAYANQRMADTMGYSQAEFLKLWVSDIHREEDLPEVLVFFEAMERGRREKAFDVPFKRRDGSLVFFDVTASLFLAGDSPCLMALFHDVTQRRERELALKESEDRFRVLFGGLSDAVFVLELAEGGRPGPFIEANAMACRLLGYTRQELLDKTPLDIVASGTELEVAVLVGRLREKGTVAFEQRLKAKDGREVPVEVTLRRIRVEGKQAVLSLVRDITERKNAEAALRQTTERLELLISRMPTGCIMWDPELRVQLWNPAAEAIFGYSAAEALGRHAGDLLLEKGSPPQAGIRHLTGNSATHTVLSCATKDRGAIMCEWYNTPMVQEGKFLGVLSMVQDITIRALSQKRLRETLEERDRLIEQLELFNKAIEATQVGVTISDRDRKIIYANPAEARMHGYGVGELLGRRTRLYAGLDEALQPGLSGSEFTEGWVRESFNKRKDGTEFPVLLSSVSLRDKEGDPHLIVTVCEDLSKVKEAEAELKKLVAQRDVLLKEIHHRVKNNMAVISSLLSLQSAKVKDEEARKFFLEGLGRIKAMSLVHEKLYQGSDFSEVNAREYLESLLAYIARNYTPADRTVRWRTEVEDLTLDIDTLLPCGLMINEILTNSLKHAFKDRLEGEVQVSLRREEGWTVLRISDNGPGLPEGFDRSASGGMGLMLIDSLASQVRGEVRMTGQGGVAFSIRIPDR